MPCMDELGFYICIMFCWFITPFSHFLKFKYGIDVILLKVLCVI